MEVDAMRGCGLAQWKVFCKSGPSEVYRAISTPLGRERFWASSAQESDRVIAFVLPDGRADESRIERADQDRLYRVRYFGQTITFVLTADASGGTELTLSADAVDAQAGANYVSLLLRLKALVDFGVDLRNGDEGRTTGYVDS
jgi:hypothetical protein